MPKDKEKKKDTSNWYDALLGTGMAKGAKDKLKGRKKQLDAQIKKAGG